MLYVPALRVLARLLLADGAPVAAGHLRTCSNDGGSVAQGTLKSHLQQIKAAGCHVERIGGGPALKPLRYRLLRLPPDDVLDELLVVVREVRAESSASIRSIAPVLLPRASGW